MQELINYNKILHDIAAKDCGKIRGNGGGWMCERRYQDATMVLAKGYQSNSGAVVPPLRKRYRIPGRMPQR